MFFVINLCHYSFCLDATTLYKYTRNNIFDIYILSHEFITYYNLPL